MRLLHVITDLGDAALLLPASAAVLAYLLYIRSTRTASIWATTLALCVTLTVLGKLALYTCASDLYWTDLRSPSGHTSISVTFYGCCALMMGVDKERWTRLLLAGAGAATAMAIAASRVLLGAHTITDVIVGSAIGVFCVAWFASRYVTAPRSPLPWASAVVALALAAVLMHGRHWTIEATIAHVVQILHAHVASFCA